MNVAPRPWLPPVHPCHEAPGGALLRTLEGHTDCVTAVAVTMDGKRAVSASGDRTLKAWDLEVGLLIATFCCDAPALCCVGADENRIVAGYQGDRVCFLVLE
jgi:WD40 repeat protein